MIGKRGGANLKRIGTKAGIYDLQCMWLGGDGWIEAKASSSVKNAQREFGAYLDRVDKPPVISRTIATSLHALGDWGAPVDRLYLTLTRLHTP